MLLRWEQKDLSEASGVSLPSIKRLETQPGELSAQHRTIQAIVQALERAGVEFIPENGGGAGVRLAKRTKRSK
jgi:predicted transcriptional regulator